MIRILRNRFQGLYHSLSRARHHKPDWKDAAFLEAISGHVTVTPTGVAGLDDEFAQTVCRRVCMHFRDRRSPAFFADGATIASLASSLAPLWRDRLRAQLNASEKAKSSCYVDPGPLHSPGFAWNRLRTGPGRDPLYSVRPHRFAHAPRMALATLLNLQDRRCAVMLEGWMRHVASGRDGLAYLSNLVVIQRFLALSWAWAFLAARPPTDGIDDGFALEFAVLKVLHADARFLWPRLGDSYPNNHLLADEFAGWYIGTLFPEFVTESSAAAKHEAPFLGELQRQILADGTSFEHSTHYHEFACEMVTVYVLLSRRNNIEPPRWVMERLERMLRFQADLNGPECLPLAVGNATEDPLFPLDSEGGWGCAAFREIYRSLFRPEFPAAPNDSPALERAFWLLGGALVPPPAQQSGVTAHEDRFRAYPDGGFFIFGGSAPDTRLVFRTGPAPGRPLVAGHMHSDLLSVSVVLGGTPVVVESGTYTYRIRRAAWPRGTPPWRAYFAGPEAHNGLAISGEDALGALEGDFRAKDVPARVVTTENRHHALGCWVEAAIECKRVHQDYRRGVVQITDEYWLIYDILPPAVPADRSSFGFQLAPDTRLDLTTVPGSCAHMVVGMKGLSLAWSNGLAHPCVMHGSAHPLGGWVSPSYGELLPAPQIRFGVERAEGLASSTAFLLLPTAGSGPRARIETSRPDIESLAFRIVTDGMVDYVLLRTDRAPHPIEAWGIQFDGALLWLRTSCARGPMELRWLAGRSIRAGSLGLDVRSSDVVEALGMRSTGKGFKITEGPADLLTAVWPAGPSVSVR